MATKVSAEGHDPIKWYKKKARKLALRARDSVFPFHPHELVYILTLWIILDALSLAPLTAAVDTLEKIGVRFIGASLLLHLSCLISVAIPVLLITVQIIRFSITLMLYYHGWLFESVGKPPSIQTKAFMFVISLLSKRAKYFSFQGLMPWMLPPNIEQTITKYLDTVRPLMDDDHYTEICDQAKEFQNTIAPELQKKLWLKWLISRNYLSGWWKEVVYMRYRNSLINTNVACADVIYRPTTSIQAARAAWVTLNRQHFVRDMFTRNTMKPISMGGIPLCSQQYIDYNRTLRVPMETSDIMIRLPESRHIAVHSKGCWYKVNVCNGKKMIKPAELERTMQNIIDAEDTSQQGEQYLSALTCGPRDLWARIRRDKFAEGVNKESLTFIENALEIVFLDEEERFFDESDSTKYDREYARSLTGDGYKLWCDKPSVYIFSKNGRFTSNAEHSVVDAMIYVHVREYVKYHETFDRPYGPDGHCIGEVDYVPKAERMCWDLDQETLSAIDEAYKVSKGVSDDFDNASAVFSDYGKEFMKKAKVSPDAYIQMALQMAYYKEQQKFELSYEPAVMRLFKDGRTETVRSCSNQSCDFVKSMLNKDDDSKTRLSKLKVACDRHQDYYRNAMAGKGVDRHLFAFYVVSKYYQIPSAFLDNVFSMNYALSTSQTPQHQMTEYSKALNKERDLFWPAGAFTCPEGSNYGACYTIGSTGDILSFHVTSWKSLKNTVLGLYVPGTIGWLISQDWLAGNFLCQMMRFVDLFVWSVSSNIMVCIAVYRLFALRYPLYISAFGHSRVPRMLITAWGLAAITVIPQIFVWNEVDIGNGRKQCMSIWVEKITSGFNGTSGESESEMAENEFRWMKFYSLQSVTITFYIPLIILIVCYFLILKDIYRTLNNDEGSSAIYVSEISTCVKSKCGGAKKDVESSVSIRTVQRGQDKFCRAKIRSLRITLLLIMTYVITWLPYNLLQWWMVISFDTYRHFQDDTYPLHFLIILNSVINPFIYGRFQGLRMLLSWRPFKKDPKKLCKMFKA